MGKSMDLDEAAAQSTAEMIELAELRAERDALKATVEQMKQAVHDAGCSFASRIDKSGQSLALLFPYSFTALIEPVEDESDGAITEVEAHVETIGKLEFERDALKAEVDRLLAAISRGGLDLSPCRGCGEPVVCIPDGPPYCAACPEENRYRVPQDENTGINAFFGTLPDDDDESEDT